MMSTAFQIAVIALLVVLVVYIGILIVDAGVYYAMKWRGRK